MTRLPILLIALVAAPAFAADQKVTYDDHVKPLLRARCFGCHNVDKKSGGLDMSSYTSLMQGGASGDIVEPGDADLSYLYLLVTHQSQPNMPPNAEKLPQAELDTIAGWINGGLLETASSKAKLSDKPKFEMSLAGAPTERPATPPLPWRLSLDPVVHTEQVDAVTAIATNPWSPLAAVASQHQVLLYDTKSGDLLGVLPFPEGRAQVLRFSRSGELLLAAGGQGASHGVAVLWNVRTGERVAVVGDEADEVLAADVSADQKFIALGGPNRVVRVYSIETGEVVYSLKKHTDWIESIAFSPDGVLLATADRNGGLEVWEALTGREYLTLKGHTGGVGSLSWRIDGNLLASGSADGSIKLWEMENGNAVKSWGAHGGGTTSVEFARDGRVVSCGRDKVTKIWDQEGKALRSLPALPDIALRVSICDETNHVVAGDWSGRVTMWNAEDGAPVANLTVNPPELDQRLKEAEASLVSVEANYEQLDAAAKAAEAEAAKQTAALDAATQQMAAATQAITDATNTMNAAKSDAAKQAEAKTAATTAAAAVEPLVPLLDESHAKSAAALAKAPADEDLKSLVAVAKTQLDMKTAALAAATKAATEAGIALDAANAQITATMKTITDSTATLESAKKSVADLTPVVKSATEKATAARAAAEAVVPQRTAAAQRVERARSSIAFAGELKALAVKQAERTPFAEAVAEVEAKSNEAKQAIDEATANLATTTRQQADLAAAMKATTDAMATTSAARDAATKQSADLAAVLVPLGESVEKADAAVAKLPGDEGLTKAVEGLKAELAAKSKAMAEAKLAANTRAAELVKLTETQQQQSARLDATAKGITQMQTQVAATEAEMQSVTAGLESARAKLAEFDTQLKQVEDRVQALRTVESADDANARADAT